jgi:hypothetical protein
VGRCATCGRRAGSYATSPSFSRLATLEKLRKLTAAIVVGEKDVGRAKEFRVRRGIVA